MRRGFTLLFSALVIQFSFGLTNSAHAAQTLTLIAEDSFDYSGNLVGKDGGFGFTNAWTFSSGTSNYGISSPTLTYPGITSTGGFVNGCSVLNGQLCAVTRSIPLQSSGKVFVQMIVNFGSQSGGGTPNLRFADELNQGTGAVGANGGTYSSKISILDSTLNAKADGSSSAGTLNGQGFLIVGVDYNENLTSLWLNPDMDTFNYFSTPTPSAMYAGLAPKIQTLNIVSRYSNMKFDELKIYKVSGTTAAEDNEAAAAAKKRADEAREAQVRAARVVLKERLETQFPITEQNLIEAGLPLRKPESMVAAYLELINFQKTLSEPLSEPEKTQIMTFTVMKYATIEKMSDTRSTSIYSRELVQYGLIPIDTPQKTRIVSAVLKMPINERNSLEKFQDLVKKEVTVVENRRARLFARLARSL